MPEDFWSIDLMGAAEALGSITGEDLRDLRDGRIGAIHFAGKDKPWDLAETEEEHLWTETALRLPDTEEAAHWKRRVRAADRSGDAEDGSDLLKAAGRYVVYGYSKISRAFLDRSVRQGARRPEAFIDRDPAKAGLSYGGVRCLGPDAAVAGEDTLIVIAAQASWREIRDELMAAGIAADRILRYRKKDDRVVTCIK